MKKFFYELNFRYTDYNNDNHYFLIGYFSSMTNAKQAIEKVRYKQGFKDFEGIFEIEKFGVNFDKKTTESEEIILYELSHEYLDSKGYDNFTVFGLYSSLEEAQKIQLKKSKQKPYINYPDCFLIAECKIDLCGWTEGFSTW
ncbi:MAG: hypothetical protein E7612_05770 [Ruminococcaceae bacterium]|nr:hypothetical protein [Oscillospiraceae bacterium]